MDHTNLPHFDTEGLETAWARAEQAAVAVFRAATDAGTEVHAAGAAYGFLPKKGENTNNPNLPKPGVKAPRAKARGFRSFLPNAVAEVEGPCPQPAVVGASHDGPFLLP